MFIDYANIDNNEIRHMIKELNGTGLLTKRIVLLPNMRKNAYVTAFIKEGIEQCHDLGVLDSVPDAIYDYYRRIAKPEKKPPSDRKQITAEAPPSDRKHITAEAPPSDRKHITAEAPPKCDTNVELPTIEVDAKNDSAEVEPSCTRKKSRPSKKRKIPTVAKANKRKQRGIKIAADSKDSVDSDTVTDRVESNAQEPTTHVITGDNGSNGDASKKIVRDKTLETRVTRARVFSEMIQDGVNRTRAELIQKMNEVYGGSEAEAAYWVGGYCSLLIALGKLRKYSDGTFEYIVD